MSSVSLSVVVGAIHDSDTVRDLARTLEPQLAAVAGELIVADGSDEGIVGVDCALHLPGADVFTLRAEALRIARGDIVAVTEDHALPIGDWCEAILKAHAERPEAALVGWVENHSTASIMDWSHFLLTWAHFLPPLPPRDRSRMPPAANVAFKRGVLIGIDIVPGRFELEVLPHLYDIGELVFDNSFGIGHVQERGAESLLHHFHNGRGSVSMPRRRIPRRERLWRVLRSPLQPWRLTYHSFREARARPDHRRIALCALPFMLLVAHAHAVGEAIGLVAGPGGSLNEID